MYHDEDYCSDPQCDCHYDSSYHEAVTVSGPLTYTDAEYADALERFGHSHDDDEVEAAA